MRAERMSGLGEVGGCGLGYGIWGKFWVIMLDWNKIMNLVCSSLEMDDEVIEA